MHDIKRNLAGGLALGAALGLGIAPVADAASGGHGRSVHPKKGAAFVGVSSQKSGMGSGALSLPVDLRVSPNGQVMSRFDIQWAAACQNAAAVRGSYGGLSITLNKKITAAGTFSDNGQFTRPFSNGDKGLFMVKVAGHFTSPVRVAGTFQVTVEIKDGSGAITNRCDSQPISWSATN